VQPTRAAVFDPCGRALRTRLKEKITQNSFGIRWGYLT